MPIRWYGPADPTDPTYRHFERIVNLCLHGGVFAAVNSGLWFVQRMRHPWPQLGWLTGTWALVWLAQLLLVLQQRPKPEPQDPS